jgi:predicted acyl esterase
MSSEWLFYRPYHTHDEPQKLVPGEIVPVEVEIWPTSIIFAPGEQLVLEVASRDDPGLDPFLHNHAVHQVQSGSVTVHTGSEYDSHLFLSLIP